jgi:hypothetical protein
MTDDDRGRTVLDPTFAPACTASGASIALLPDATGGLLLPALVRARALAAAPNATMLPLRGHDFLAYARFEYPVADPGALRPILALAQDGAGGHLLQLGASAEALPPEPAPLALTVLVDVSMAMQGAGLDLARQALHAIAGHLRAGDTVALVTTESDPIPKLVGYDVAGPNDDGLLTQVDALAVTGGADLSSGITAAVSLLQQLHEPGRTSRLVVLTAGTISPMPADLQALSDATAPMAGRDLSALAIGVGMVDGASHVGVELLAEAGGGVGLWLPAPEAVDARIGQEFGATFRTAALEVKFELQLPDGVELTARAGIDVTPPARRSLGFADSVVQLEHLAPCVAPLDPSEEIGLVVRWLDPASGTERKAEAHATIQSLLGADDPGLHEARVVEAYVTGLRGHRDGATGAERAAALDDALAAIAAESGLLGADPDVIAMKQVLEALHALPAG